MSLVSLGHDERYIGRILNEDSIAVKGAIEAVLEKTQSQTRERAALSLFWLGGFAIDATSKAPNLAILDAEFSWQDLSVQERAILRSRFIGQTSNEAARDIYHKLGAKNRVHALWIALNTRT